MEEGGGEERQRKRGISEYLQMVFKAREIQELLLLPSHHQHSKSFPTLFTLDWENISLEDLCNSPSFPIKATFAKHWLSTYKDSP